MPKSHRVEVQVAKSPAEFFAENQAIAGFDNMGKALYTTLRELVENSLDACESVNVLPDIVVEVEEMTQKQFNVERGLTKKGMQSPQKKDLGLFDKSKGRKSTGKEAKAESQVKMEEGATDVASGKKPSRKKASQ